MGQPDLVPTEARGSRSVAIGSVCTGPWHATALQSVSLVAAKLVTRSSARGTSATVGVTGRKEGFNRTWQQIGPIILLVRREAAEILTSLLGLSIRLGWNAVD